MKVTRYKQIQDDLKTKIQHGIYVVGDYLPSENELCTTYNITRTTARKALEELQKEGFIIRQHGKGSQVRERRESLGLLTVKGFSEAVNLNIKTEFLQKPHLIDWDDSFPFKPSIAERSNKWIYFSRLRYVNDSPVIVEHNWFSIIKFPGFIDQEFVQDSFFRTLSQRYLTEITGSEQELRALEADNILSLLLQTEEKSPILQIQIKYYTSKPNCFIYSQLN